MVADVGFDAVVVALGTGYIARIDCMCAHNLGGTVTPCVVGVKAGTIPGSLE